MGKYLPSSLQNKYSDWHWHVLGKLLSGNDCYLADIDKIWVEVRKKEDKLRPVALIDIKEPNRTTTPTEKAIYEFLEDKTQVPVFIVYTNFPFKWFKVMSWKTKLIQTFNSEEEYANWIKSL